MVWEIMVRVRLDTNISMLDVYSKALRPALSIKTAAMATEMMRTTPTRAASYLTDIEHGWVKIWSKMQLINTANTVKFVFCTLLEGR